MPSTSPSTSPIGHIGPAAPSRRFAALLAFVVLATGASGATAASSEQNATPVFRTLNGEPLALADFHRFVGFEHRADPRFESERTALFSEFVIREEAKRRSIEARPEQVEARYVELDREAKKHDPRGLEAVLIEQDVGREEFLRRLEAALLLERIVRSEFDIDDARVPEEKQNVWLQDRMSKTHVQHDDLPRDLLARIDGRDVTLEEYGRRIVDRLTRGSPLRRNLEQAYLEANAVRQYAMARGVELRDADVDAEITRREKKLREQPGMQDATLDEVLSENGGSVADLRASLRFRTRLLLERLCDEVEFKGADLYSFYRSHQAGFDELYGEQAVLSIIFLKAGASGAVEAGFVRYPFEAAIKELTNLRTDLEAGRGTFENAAKVRSEHPSASKGGYVGPVGVRTEAIGDLTRQVLAARDRGELKVGDLFGPVRLVDGVHLVKLNGFTPRKRFEDILPDVRKHAMNELLRSIMGKAEVKE